MSTPYVAVLAGGSGTRLWPLSRRNRPKFLADVGTGRPLLAEALDKALMITVPDRVVIVTGTSHARATTAIAEEQGVRRILVEPQPRDTTAAIAAAALYVQRREPSAPMVTMPSDHLVGSDGWTESIGRALHCAAQGHLVCLAVVPDAPATGFGYIHAPQQPDRRHHDPRPVLSFTEKPDLRTAGDYLRDGNYLWNTAIMSFHSDRFLELLERHAPDISSGVATALTVSPSRPGSTAWSKIRARAVERAVLEPAAADGALMAVPAAFTWTDVGSWDAMAERPNGPYLADRLYQQDADCYVAASAGKRRYVLLGVKDLVIVDCDDVLLVADRHHAQQLRQVVEALQARGWSDLL
ncbi:mannose-1-phosphate guanylyltransferase [Catenulispora sp. GAS73]|uniref:mannose-1-phosphate guanylyltransferase n=1 Tax=Catenulispora sp. GAS73 TaxID=3156269 RepID=UPI0035155578